MVTVKLFRATAKKRAKTALIIDKFIDRKIATNIAPDAEMCKIMDEYWNTMAQHSNLTDEQEDAQRYPQIASRQENTVTAEQECNGTITVKELAKTLGVSTRTIKRTSKKLDFRTLSKSTGGRPTAIFTQKQAALIKQDIEIRQKSSTKKS